MMKNVKIFLLIAFLVLVGLTGGVLAQETKLPDPGLTPDSPFYFLERISEAIGNFFTFGELAKANRYSQLSAERLSEARAMAEKNKSEFMQKTLLSYERYTKLTSEKIAIAKERGKKIEEVAEKTAQRCFYHFLVLDEVLEKVPVWIKPAIEKAKEVSLMGGQKILENLILENPEKTGNIIIKAQEDNLAKMNLERIAKVAQEPRQLEKLERKIRDFIAIIEMGNRIFQKAEDKGLEVGVLNKVLEEGAAVNLEALKKGFQQVRVIPIPAKGEPDNVLKIREFLTKATKSILHAENLRKPLKEVELEVRPIPLVLTGDLEKELREKIRKESVVELAERKPCSCQSQQEAVEQAKKALALAEDLVQKSQQALEQVEQEKKEAEEAAEEALEKATENYEKTLGALERFFRLVEILAEDSVTFNENPGAFDGWVGVSGGGMFYLQSQNGSHQNAAQALLDAWDKAQENFGFDYGELLDDFRRAEKEKEIAEEVFKRDQENFNSVEEALEKAQEKVKEAQERLTETEKALEECLGKILECPRKPEEPAEEEPIDPSLQEDIFVEPKEEEKPEEEEVWPPENTILNTYQLTSDFSEVCDEMDNKGPVVKIVVNGVIKEERMAGAVDCYYFWGDSTVVRHYSRDEHGCKCIATITVIVVTTEITIILPEWEGYDLASEKEKGKWDRFFEALKEHEQGHVNICKEEKEGVKKAIKGVGSGTGWAITCKEACDDALQDLRNQADTTVGQAASKAFEKQKKYDQKTNHGETQGVVLDCTCSTCTDP